MIPESDFEGVQIPDGTLLTPKSHRKIINKKIEKDSSSISSATKISGISRLIRANKFRF